MDFLLDEVLLPRELFHSKVNGLLQVHYLLLEPLDLFVKHLEALLIFFVLLENAGEFLLFDHYFVEKGSVIHKISAL